MIVTKIVLKIMLNNKKLKAYWYFATIVLIAKTIMEIFVEWKKVYEYIYIGTPCLIALGFVYFIIQGLCINKNKDTAISATIGFIIMVMYVLARLYTPYPE
jgi:hypothetical protein